MSARRTRRIAPRPIRRDAVYSRSSDQLSKGRLLRFAGTGPHSAGDLHEFLDLTRGAPRRTTRCGRRTGCPRRPIAAANCKFELVTVVKYHHAARADERGFARFRISSWTCALFTHLKAAKARQLDLLPADECAGNLLEERFDHFGGFSLVETDGGGDVSDEIGFGEGHGEATRATWRDVAESAVIDAFGRCSKHCLADGEKVGATGGGAAYRDVPRPVWPRIAGRRVAVEIALDAFVAQRVSQVSQSLLRPVTAERRGALPRMGRAGKQGAPV